ncbi:MAG: hypothetical protein NTX96_00035, partial [Candidatus Zambryskibacteria bacterium]|nr:hypothetical protein [Candidatus Zambryskibacteria bacterium]
MKKILTKHKKKAFLCLVLICIFLFFFLLPKVLSVHYLSLKETSLSKIPIDTVPKKEVFIPSYISTPEPVKGIYMTSWTASNQNLREALVKLINETELNTIVIDIKDYSGKIVFSLDDNPKLKSFGSEEVRIKDLRDFIESLHKKNIYVIGRVAVFQDAYFVKYRPDLAVKNKTGEAVWKDKKGISWIDPGSREYWDYIILLAEEGRKVGFDEINFDYIRFPSDGDMQDISYPFSSSTPKHIVMKNFFEYLHDGLVDSGLKISADVFGMVTTATNDMGIGQLLEDVFPYFDYVMPMVYPSHYPPTFEGFENPEAYPYEVVHFALEGGVTRAIIASTTPNKIRPWLQDFGLKMNYGSTEV